MKAVVQRLGVVLLAASAVPVALAEPQSWRISGTAERLIHPRGPCHGGVAVRDEELADLEARVQRISLAKADFTVFRGSRRAGKPVTTFSTDRAGRFEVRLPKGTYCVVAGRHNATTKADEPPEPVEAAGPDINADCLRELAQACDATLLVRGKDAKGVKVTLHTFTPCPQQWAQPCYRGPMPP